jgi:type II secretory pathway component PulJ
VEFLVATAIGMLILTAGALVWAEQIKASHLLIRQARLDHDLRASTRLIARHLRRAGHWSDPDPARPNPYAELTLSGQGAIFRASRDATENHRVDGNEVFGVRLRHGVLELALGTHNWQALTDPNTVTIRSFTLTPQRSERRLPSACAASCPGPCSSLWEQRSLKLQIIAESVGRSPLTREFQALVHLRNDAVHSDCLSPSPT